MASRSWPPLVALFLAAGVAVTAVVGTAVPAASKESEHADEARPKLKLKLVADPQVGFTPLVTMLTGTLSGVSPDDPNFCHPAVTWIKVSPGQLEENASRFHQESGCRHPPGEAEAMTTFTRMFDLYRPGSYQLKLVVEGKDHRRVESGYVQVQVLRVQ